MGNILVLNTGSSSVKFAIFGEDQRELLRGSAEGIGATTATTAANGPLGILKSTASDQRRALDLPNHEAALDAVLALLQETGFDKSQLVAVAHRVVHGGTALTMPTQINAQTRAQIAECVPLAPLHNPHALSAIDAMTRLAPKMIQCASFDTSFHATNPDLATHYALPPEVTARGIRRYGFHGLSYAALTRNLPNHTGTTLPARVLALHLGNGASLCAIHEGRSVATTMGYSPLEGLTMGTRSGSIDPNAVLRLAEEDGIAATRSLLNGQSGLLGLSELTSDMRSLSEAATPAARFAIDHFCYWALRHAGGLIAAMGGVDAVVFTGGIGENDAHVRAEILRGLAWVGLEIDDAANVSGASQLHLPGSRVSAWIIPAEEERQIALDARSVLEAQT